MTVSVQERPMTPSDRAAEFLGNRTGDQRTRDDVPEKDRSDAAVVVIPSDHSYGPDTRYRAAPLLPLLTSLPNGRFDTLEARATDGLVAQIPLSLVGRGGEGGATAWIAVEQPGQPWPNLPGRSTGAGPFYLVWTNPERSGVTNAQWVYNLASLTATESPAHRWPQLAADPSLPQGAPARWGGAGVRGQLPALPPPERRRRRRNGSRPRAADERNRLSVRPGAARRSG